VTGACYVDASAQITLKANFDYGTQSTTKQIGPWGVGDTRTYVTCSVAGKQAVTSGQQVTASVGWSRTDIIGLLISPTLVVFFEPA
jgi:hypothetical protein